MKGSVKPRGKAGFSLIEVLVAIVLLALVTIPVCSGMVLAHRVNAKSAQLLEDQLRVTAALERLMAEGIMASDPAIETGEGETVSHTGDVSGVRVTTVQNEDGETVLTIEIDRGGWAAGEACAVTVRSGEVEVPTFIRPNLDPDPADPADPAEGGGGG